MEILVRLRGRCPIRRVVVLVVHLRRWTVAGRDATAADKFQEGARHPERARARANLYLITGDTYEVGGRPTWTGGNVAVFVIYTEVVLVDSHPGCSARKTPRFRADRGELTAKLTDTATDAGRWLKTSSTS
jgi:hypothetical protein